MFGHVLDLLTFVTSGWLKNCPPKIEFLTGEFRQSYHLSSLAILTQKHVF
jgi:hypothetical protein